MRPPRRLRNTGSFGTPVYGAVDRPPDGGRQRDQQAPERGDPGEAVSAWGRLMLQDRACHTIAVNSPTPGRAVNTLTRGWDFALACTSRSSCSMVGAMASMTAMLSATICRDTAGRGSPECQARPGPVQ
jgi:hypothetical protein